MEQRKYWDSVSEQKEFTLPLQAYRLACYVGKDGRILDVGCGNGFTANYLAGKGYDVYGIDASRQGIAIANRTGGGIPAVSSSAT